jgi:hypothetical protein
MSTPQRTGARAVKMPAKKAARMARAKVGRLKPMPRRF